MKKRIAIFATLVLMFLTAGCKAQQITPVPIMTAPAVTDVAFVQLNTAAPTSALTYLDLPATGNWCYFVQMLDNGGVSAASNTTCNVTTAALKHINLTWSAGVPCVSGACKYVVSRAPAVLTPVAVPAQGASSQSASAEPAPAIFTHPAIALTIASR